MKTIKNAKNKKLNLSVFFCASEKLKIIHDNTQILFGKYHVDKK
jgi:hypothetical protein